jgi:hypothetical protein
MNVVELLNTISKGSRLQHGGTEKGIGREQWYTCAVSRGTVMVLILFWVPLVIVRVVRALVNTNSSTCKTEATLVTTTKIFNE